MKNASQFREQARSVLQGKWGIAVLAGFLSSLLGGNGSSVNLNINTGNNSGYPQNLIQHIPEQFRGILAGAGITLLIVAIAVAVAWTVLISVIGTGYSKFNLRLVDREEASIDVMFSCFPQWKTVTVASLLTTLYVFLWSLLLIIPGIVAGLSYAMVYYIMAEHPELTASEAMEQSRMIMEGNRWRLFCLNLSFIGWRILAALSFGIGNLWVTPYLQAAQAAFYREISGTERHPFSGEPVTE